MITKHAAIPTPSREALLELFDYDRETGTLTWRVRADKPMSVNAAYAGKLAGSLDPKGYRKVVIDGRSYMVHRLIWKLETDEEPPLDIDHRDGNADNNRFANFRTATAIENPRNQKRRAGHKWPKGVEQRHGRYRASNSVAGKRVYLGTHDTPEQAAAAYLRGAQDHYGQFARAA